MKRITLIVTLTLIILSSAAARAANSSASYTMVSCVLDSSGASGQTPSFMATTSAGEPAINLFIGQNHYLKAGFLYIALGKKPDKTPPAGTITINDEAAYTSSDSVTLTLSAQDEQDGSGIDKMQFSNDNSDWSSPEAYAASKTWQLSAGDGEKTVYVRFYDKAGNASDAASDTIMLDTTLPAIDRITPDSGAIMYESEKNVISVEASSPNGGVLEYQFSVDDVVAQPWGVSDSYEWASGPSDIGSHQIKVEVRKPERPANSATAHYYIGRKPLKAPEN